MCDKIRYKFPTGEWGPRTVLRKISLVGGGGRVEKQRGGTVSEVPMLNGGVAKNGRFFCETKTANDLQRRMQLGCEGTLHPMVGASLLHETAAPAQKTNFLRPSPHSKTVPRNKEFWPYSCSVRTVRTLRLGKSSGSRRNFVMGLIERNNYDLSAIQLCV